MGDNRFRRFFKENLKEMLREVASLFTGQKSARWQHLPENFWQISFQPVHPTKDSSCAADNRFFKKLQEIQENRSMEWLRLTKDMNHGYLSTVPTISIYVADSLVLNANLHYNRTTNCTAKVRVTLLSMYEISHERQSRFSKIMETA